MPTLPNGRSVVRFGAFEADLSSGEIHKHGHKIKLQEQPFQVLVMLLERPGKVITREELRARLWPADTFVDFDTGLNSAIKKLRDALGDSAEEPAYVETLPRRGYRFVAQLEHQTVADVPCTQKESEASNKHAAEPVLGAVRSAPALTRPRPWWRKRRVAFVASALTLSALLGLAVGAWRGGLVRSAHAMRIEAIAVLPLENMTGDPTQEYLVDGMTDALTTHLAQMRGMRVISRTSAMRFKGSKKGLQEIARELHVDAVVEGSVSRSNEVTHVNAQLVYAPGDRHLWAHSYDIRVVNLPNLQAEIAGAVVNAIGATDTPETAAQLSMAHPVN